MFSILGSAFGYVGRNHAASQLLQLVLAGFLLFAVRVVIKRRRQQEEREHAGRAALEAASARRMGKGRGRGAGTGSAAAKRIKPTAGSSRGGSRPQAYEKLPKHTTTRECSRAKV